MNCQYNEVDFWCFSTFYFEFSTFFPSIFDFLFLNWSLYIFYFYFLSLYIIYYKIINNSTTNRRFARGQRVPYSRSAKKINSFTFCRRVSFDVLPNVSSLSRNAQASRAATLRLFHYALWCKSRLDFPLSHSLHVSVPRFMQPCRGFKTAAKMSPCITAECQLPGNEKVPKSWLRSRTQGLHIW